MACVDQDGHVLDETVQSRRNALSTRARISSRSARVGFTYGMVGVSSSMRPYLNNRVVRYDNSAIHGHHGVQDIVKPLLVWRRYSRFENLCLDDELLHALEGFVINVRRSIHNHLERFRWWFRSLIWLFAFPVIETGDQVSVDADKRVRHLLDECSPYLLTVLSLNLLPLKICLFPRLCRKLVLGWHEAHYRLDYPARISNCSAMGGAGL